MATNIKTLKEDNGDIVLPRTRSNAVTMTDGVTNLDDKLDDLETTKADKTEILSVDNTTPFTPDADYEPATKLYVDLVQDDLNSHKADYVTLSDTVDDHETRVSKLEGINNAPDLDNSKTYRWGLRIQDGKTQFIYEEVI